jgi:hypothetical protein
MNTSKLFPLLFVSLVTFGSQAACGSSGSAACDQVKTHCSVTDAKDKDCRDSLAVAQQKGCESSFADFMTCLVDGGSKCNAAGEMDDDLPACAAQKTSFETCMK